MVDAVHSISTQINAATAGHKRIEMILERRELIMFFCFVIFTVVSDWIVIVLSCVFCSVCILVS